MAKSEKHLLMSGSFQLRLRCLIFGILLSTQLHAQAEEGWKVDFSGADSVAALYLHHSLDDIKLLSNKLTAPFSTDVEKFRTIYRWVCDNIENDPVNFEIHAYKRKKYRDKPDKLVEWNRQFSHSVFRKLQREYKTICTGYASLVKELSGYAGIDCKIVDGYGRTALANVGGKGFVNHSWNAVFLDGQWFLCDPTWSSGAIHPDLNKFIPDFSEAYFLSKPEIFALNHFPLDTNWLMTKSPAKLNDFLKAPLVYKDAILNGVVPQFPSAFRVEVTKGDTVSFEFQTNSSIDSDKIRVQEFSGSQSRQLNAKAKRLDNCLYSLEYSFRKRGDFVVHIRLEDAYLITYSVRVNK